MNDSTIVLHKRELLNFLRDIGLALHACNNCVTTDNVEAKVETGSWRIDNSKEIHLVHLLEERLGITR